VTAARVIVLGGPTASGKSALALALAEALGGEIVAADSRQVYAGLPLASAAPDDDERRRAPHHLYGVIDPSDTLSAGRFIALADAAIKDIVARGRVAIVVGGTGLYLRALRVGLDDDLPSDPRVRAAIEAELRAAGLAAVVARLRELDPEASEGLDLKNPVRVVRALELALLGAPGRRDVQALLHRPPRPVLAEASWLLVDVDTAALAGRIAARTARMFATRAILDEALALAGRLPPDHALLHTIGVAEALAAGRGALSVDDAVARVAARTRQYARRQRTWFRKEPWWTAVAPDDVGAARAIVAGHSRGG
jgi:tRNA dimethylallyltransferase